MDTTTLLQSLDDEFSRLRREAERERENTLITLITPIASLAQNARRGRAAPALLDPRTGRQKDCRH